MKGEIQLLAVTFHYPNRPSVNVFDKFSLTIAAGKTLALVGESGSGKSTVVGLIERFYEPVSGAVLLDGFDIRGYQLRYLRSQVRVWEGHQGAVRGTVKCMAYDCVDCVCWALAWHYPSPQAASPSPLTARVPGLRFSSGSASCLQSTKGFCAPLSIPLW